MRVTFRTKLLASHVALAIVAPLAAAIAIDRTSSQDMEQQLDARLVGQARAVTEWMSKAGHPDRLAGRLAAVVGARVVVIDRFGIAVGDSSRPEGPAGMDTEGMAREVARARAGQVVKLTRYSATTGQEMRYVLVPAPKGLVVRLGVPLANLDDTRLILRRRLSVAAAATLLIGVLLAVFIAQSLSHRVRDVGAVAARIGRGDYELPPASASTDEIGVLSRTLSQAAGQLRAIDETRRQFLADVAHELRTPVTAIRGYAETLSQGEVDVDTRSEFLDTIHRNAIRIGELVEDLLRLEALEAAPAASGPHPPVALAQVVANAAGTLRGTAEAAGATIDVDVPDDITARVDADELEQVVQNLLANAIRYGGAGVTVALRARRLGDRARLQVSDDGPGIAAEHLPRLFDRFYRVGSGRSRDDGGSGLGLAIVKRMVEGAGGTITVTSETGQGTTFTVELPA